MGREGPLVGRVPGWGRAHLIHPCVPAAWPRYRVVGSADAGQYNLEITDAELSDDASYECQATEAALRSRRAKLTVLSKALPSSRSFLLSPCPLPSSWPLVRPHGPPASFSKLCAKPSPAEEGKAGCGPPRWDRGRVRPGILCAQWVGLYRLDIGLPQGRRVGVEMHLLLAQACRSRASPALPTAASSPSRCPRAPFLLTQPILPFTTLPPWPLRVPWRPFWEPGSKTRRNELEG